MTTTASGGVAVRDETIAKAQADARRGAAKPRSALGKLRASSVGRRRRRMSALSIYALKPRFQALLRPLAAALARAGVTANQVTVAACVVSVGARRIRRVARARALRRSC